jgi:hypothetical protein
LCTVPVCIVDGPGRQGQRTGESTSVRFPITDEGKKALTPPSIVLVSPCTHHFFCHLARLWIDWPANEENISGQVRERFATLFCPKVSPRSSRWWWSYLFIHFWNDCRQQRSAAALYLPVRALLYTNINNKPIDPNIRTVDRQDRAIIVPPSSASRSNLVVRSSLFQQVPPIFDGQTSPYVSYYLPASTWKQKTQLLNHHWTTGPVSLP